MQPHVSVLVNVLPHHPRLRGQHVDVQLLFQLAHGRLCSIFTGFELAARELPPAFIGLAGRTLAQQDLPIRTHQDTDGDIDDLGSGHGNRHALACRMSCMTDQSLAGLRTTKGKQPAEPLWYGTPPPDVLSAWPQGAGFNHCP